MLSLTIVLFALFFSGFCFLEYESHKAASLAKRRLETGRIKVWSCDIIVDWADPQEEPDDDTMGQVWKSFLGFFAFQPQYTYLNTYKVEFERR